MPGLIFLQDTIATGLTTNTHFAVLAAGEWGNTRHNMGGCIGCVPQFGLRLSGCRGIVWGMPFILPLQNVHIKWNVLPICRCNRMQITVCGKGKKADYWAHNWHWMDQARKGAIMVWAYHHTGPWPQGMKKRSLHTISVCKVAQQNLCHF